jgi:diacylglycerol O-acyltransferase / wax synthase
MESFFPMVPLARRQALCVGIMSYNGQVNLGLVGDYDAMADLDSFALDLEAATREVIATAPKAGAKAKTQAKKKTKKSNEKAAASSNGSGPSAAVSR